VIFVTVGSQLPFDRMTLAVADWARARGRTDVFFQTGVGSTDVGEFESRPTLPPDEIARRFDEATVVVAHAGTGSIIECLSRAKPVIIVPRASNLGETRNDHQFATAERFKDRPGVFVARNERELPALLDRAHELSGGARITAHADARLTDALRQFVLRNSVGIDPPARAARPPRVLAISSQGGHWVQLLRLRPALERSEIVWASTDSELRHDVPGDRFEVVRDSNRWSKLDLIRSAISVLAVILRTRPDVVVSTGAAPGYFAIRFAKLLGARTLWIDSIANSSQLSLSGERALRVADVTLVQWPELESGAPDGPDARRPRYAGAVL
jgi:UDP-N-acetylglucosamine:LPS N-acetylglucosamine transferase